MFIASVCFLILQSGRESPLRALERGATLGVSVWRHKSFSKRDYSSSSASCPPSLENLDLPVDSRADGTGAFTPVPEEGPQLEALPSIVDEPSAETLTDLNETTIGTLSPIASGVESLGVSARCVLCVFVRLCVQFFAFVFSHWNLSHWYFPIGIFPIGIFRFAPIANLV